MRFFVRRRESPILTARTQLIRRRADSRTRGEESAIHPQVRTESVGRQREIVIEADLHPAIECAFLSLRELNVNLPLEKFEQLNALRKLFGELLHIGRLRILKLLGPLRPQPHIRIAAMHLFVERAVNRVPMERFALGLLIFVERRVTARFFESIEGAGEGTQLERRYTLILDKLALAQLGCFHQVRGLRLGVGDSRDVEIKKVPKVSALRQIRTRVVRLPIRDCVKRIESDECRARTGECVNGVQQVREIPAAPVVRGTQAVETQRDSCGPTLELTRASRTHN